MTNERPGLFTELEPPPGGAARFRQRLDETESSPHASRWRVVASAGAACAMIALTAAVFLLRDPNDSASSSAGPSERTAEIFDAPEFDRLLGRTPRPAELTVTLNEQPASVAEIETTNEKVRIYRIN